MICPSCGQEVPELKFCVNCGSPLEGVATQGFAPQPPTYQMPQTPSANHAPSAAFVLVIVGLVLSCLFVTFIPGLVCSIIGLVLNAGYGKKGLDNPRKTATTVIGIIGIVIGVLCLAATIMIGVLSAEVIDELDRQGIDITTDNVEVTTDSSGNISISVKDDESGSAASSATATGSSGAASSASSAASQAALKYDGEKYHDSDYNPTLYSILELNGSEFQDLLDLYNFYWDDDLVAWYAADGSLYDVEDMADSLTKGQISQLPAGAAGQPVAIILTVEGYSSPAAAFNALSKDVTTEATLDADDVYFAVVHGSPMAKYLVAVSETDEDEQTFLLFTDEAISSGLFEQLTGSDAGSSIDEVWNAIDNI